MGRRQRRRAAVAAAFVDRHLPMVWSYAAATLPDPARAHELTRDVVGGVDPRLLDEDDDAALRRLLLVRIRRAVRDQPQRRERGAAGGAASSGAAASRAGADRDTSASGSARPPRDLVEEFARLDDADREALLLTDVLGVDAAVAAAVCRVTPQRLRRRRHDAHRRLVERLLGGQLPGGAYCGRMRERHSAHPEAGRSAVEDRDATDGSAAVEAHLRDCDDCRTFAEALDAVLHHAPALVPPPPASLRGQVLEDLGASPTATAGTSSPGRVSRRTTMSVAAGVGGGLVGVVVVLLLAGPGTPDDDAEERLARLGELHAGTGTSHRFDIAGDLELRLPPGRRSPGRAELDEQLARLGGELGSATSLDVSFRGRGETDGRGALAYELRWRITGPVSESGVLEVVSVDQRTFLRRGGASRWVLVEGSAGFDLGAAEFPHHPGAVLRELDDLEEAATMARVEVDGEPVDHLRGRTATGMVVDAWVGVEDDWLRRLRWIPAPPDDERDGTTHGEVLVRLHEHGRARFVGAPDDWLRLEELDDERRPPFVPATDAG